MTEWREYKLSEIMETSKKQFKPDNNSQLNYIGLEHIEQGSLRLSGVGASSTVESNKFFFNKGDVLFGKLRPYFRKVIYAPFDGICSTDIWVCKAKSCCDQKFLFYFLANQDFIDTANTDEGSRMPRASWDYLKDTLWILPPLHEQKAIAEVLSSLDDKIDFLTRQNNTLEDFAQTYFRRWFLEENDNDTIMVSEIAKLENNSVSPKRQPLEPFHHYSIPAYDNAQTPVVELGNTILSNKFTVQPNSILVSKLNPITPRIWRIDENVMPNSVCSTEFQVLKPYDIKHYLFLYFLMKSDDVVSSFAMSATGTSGSHQRIRPEYILEVETPEPDNDKLILFNEICTPMMERVKKNQQQIITLQKLRDTLLPKLISGEVRVKQ
ncbi:Restriction endonuclease, type I, HsdS [Syntrophomonas zehnderi OL-4]|jgi:type I restriction enzyme S subunit|uniref:Restriction endonuclease, type I, HsdS n=1 Tax=Syntrophomonas zehnderi OL-4 TaxID=690567 RepID=A0A0E4GCZ2_9FIRM|nr:restriction endonuclease subunit S [Syntrophomonas zehnderi]CFX07584.1 Restriction endonuclease, type I, HsdS [Syntrophomonas zehnderi OL-4]CFX31713.1 Restriction endonuclease, type I, HsdS [Syntrophomonas zehnderi OL-4]